MDRQELISSKFYTRHKYFWSGLWNWTISCKICKICSIFFTSLYVNPPPHPTPTPPHPPIQWLQWSPVLNKAVVISVGLQNTLEQLQCHIQGLVLHAQTMSTNWMSQTNIIHNSRQLNDVDPSCKCVCFIVIFVNTNNNHSVYWILYLAHVMQNKGPSWIR